MYGVLDSKSTGTAEATVLLLSGLNDPNGIAWHNGSLYVAEINKITRYDNADACVRANKVSSTDSGILLQLASQPPLLASVEGSIFSLLCCTRVLSKFTAVSSQQSANRCAECSRGFQIHADDPACVLQPFNVTAGVVIFDRLPNVTHHGNRYIRISPQGRLFFDMGAPCDDCLLEKAFGNITFGSLNSMALNGTDVQPWAEGESRSALLAPASDAHCDSVGTYAG